MTKLENRLAATKKEIKKMVEGSINTVKEEIKKNRKEADIMEKALEQDITMKMAEQTNMLLAIKKE